VDPKLITLLVKHEGLRLFPYKDTAGYLTIGVGHNLTANGLTHEQVMNILEDDINSTLTFLDKGVPWWRTLDEVRQRVMIDLAFNLMGTLLTFKRMLTALQSHAWNVAADELLDSQFATQTGQRAQDLAHMLRTGEDLV
jgi:lysozyme